MLQLLPEHMLHQHLANLTLMGRDSILRTGVVGEYKDITRSSEFTLVWRL